MKKHLLFTLLLGIICLHNVSAQNPTSTWPYLFPDFRPGQVALKDGGIKPYSVNIHLRRGQLHYLDDKGLIREADLMDVEAMEVDGERFLNAGGTMMKVAAMSEKGCIAVEILGDFDALSESGGAYGMSSTTSATRKLSSIETDSQINQNHMLLLESKNEGMELDLKTRYFFVYPFHCFPATRKEVEKQLPPEKEKEWKSWLKAHKIKWNRPEDLLLVLDFLTV